MIWRVEVKEKDAVPDPAGRGILSEFADLKIATIRDVRVVSVYLLEGNVTRAQVELICKKLLVDPIVSEYSIHNTPVHSKSNNLNNVVEIAYNSGVMDPTESSTIKGIRDLGINSIDTVRTAKQYHLIGTITEITTKIARRLMLR